MAIPKRRPRDLLSAAMLAAFLAVLVLPHQGEAGTRAATSAEALDCINGVNLVIPLNHDEAREEKRSGSREVQSQRAFEGTTCQGNRTKAIATAAARFPGLGMSNAIIVDRGGWGGSFPPTASAFAALDSLFFVRNRTSGFMPVKIVFAFRGSVTGVSRRCSDPPAPQVLEACFDGSFTSTIPLIDSSGKPINTDFYRMPRNDSAYFEGTLSPGDFNLLSINYSLASEVRFQGKLTIASGAGPSDAAQLDSGTVAAPDDLPGIGVYVILPEGAEIASELESGLPGTAFAEIVLRPGQAIPAPGGSLTISPRSGTLAASQSFDLALIAQTAGQTVADITAHFDGVDVSAPLRDCVAAHTGALTLATPGFVLRCPGLSGGLAGGGTHTLSVSLTLSGGGTLTDSATWEILANAE